MRSSFFSSAGSLLLLALASLPAVTFADQILQTSGFSTCLDESNITVSKVNIKYDAGSQTVTFDVAGTSQSVINVTAILNVTAYGNNVYSNSFNPCDQSTFVSQLCPGRIPSGTKFVKFN